MIYIGKNRIHYTVVESTNEALKGLFNKEELEEGTLFTTDFQEGGKGQMGAGWKSDEGQNFLGTFLLRAKLPVETSFVLNMITSLAVRETIAEFVKETVEIKWPNDIVINGEKCSGILIENKVNSNGILASFIGVGLNVNQFDFPDFDRKATSIGKAAGEKVSLDEVTVRLCFHLQQFYALYKVKGFDTISFLYHKELYLKGEDCTYKVDGITRKLILQSVHKNGDLQLFNENGKIEAYGLKTIKFLQ